MGKVEADNKGSIVVITTILLLIVFVCGFLAKVIVKLFQKALLTAYDDLILAISVVFGIVQSVLQCVRVRHGLGRPLVELSEDEAQTALKLELASTVIYICCITLSKISPAATLTTLTPNQHHYMMAQVLIGFIAIFALSSVFAVSFQCHLPQSWDYTHERCIDRVSFWITFDVLNAVTDVLLICFPIYLILSVQLNRTKKIYFSLAFAARTSAVVAFVADAVVWGRTMRHSLPQEAFFAEWKVSITMQVAQACCLISACAVFLGRFFRSLQSGFGMDTAINTVAPIELRARTYSLARSDEGLTDAAAPISGSHAAESGSSRQGKSTKTSRTSTVPIK